MAWIAEKLLTAIRDDQVCDCITEERLVMLTGLTPKQVECAAYTLHRNHLLEKTGKGCHKLTAAGKEALISGATLKSGPKGGNQHGIRERKDTLRINVWRAMRIRRKFTVPEIISLVVDENTVGDVTNNVQKYIGALAKAGYLIEMPRREPGTAPTSTGYKRWWLQDEKNTGPKAPILSVRKHRVFDPNTGTEVAI